MWASMVPWDTITKNARSLFGMDQDEGQKDNENFQHEQGQLNENNTNQIARDTEYLKGLTQPTADAYNQYQDSTYGQDTNRINQRSASSTQQDISNVKAKADALGMSYWELNGQGGASATGVPSPGAPSAPNNNAASTSYLASLATTKMNNDTAKSIAAMNNDTSRYNTAMQTGTAQKNVAMQTNKGQVGQAQTANIQADTLLKQINETIGHATYENVQQSTAESRARTVKTVNDTINSNIELAANLAPTYTTNIPGVSRTEKLGWQKILDAKANQTAVNLSDDEAGLILKRLRNAAGNIASKTMDAGEATGEYLKNLFK